MADAPTWTMTQPPEIRKLDEILGELKAIRLLLQAQLKMMSELLKIASEKN